MQEWAFFSNVAHAQQLMSHIRSRMEHFMPNGNITVLL